MSQEQRVVVIVDLENACGGSGLVPANHKEILKIVSQLQILSPPMIVYSTGPQALLLAPSLLWEWGTARFVPGFGLDGADNALIKVMREEPITARSRRVYLVSGDHAFVEPVEELRQRGIPTTVMSNPRAISRRLAAVADEVRWLPEFDHFPAGPSGMTTSKLWNAA